MCKKLHTVSMRCVRWTQYLGHNGKKFRKRYLRKQFTVNAGRCQNVRHKESASRMYFDAYISHYLIQYTKILHIEVWLWRVLDQVDCLFVFCMLKQTQDFCVFLLFIQYRYITTCYIMQYMYKTKYALLHHVSLVSNFYKCRWSTCMYNGHFKMRVFITPG